MNEADRIKELKDKFERGEIDQDDITKAIKERQAEQDNADATELES